MPFLRFDLKATFQKASRLLLVFFSSVGKEMVDWSLDCYIERIFKNSLNQASFSVLIIALKRVSNACKRTSTLFVFVFFRTSAGSSSPEKRLPPEENSANMLVEQIQELIEFLANRFEIMTFVF